MRSRLLNASSSNPSLSAILPALTIVIFAALHVPLLRLPFFWDEAGYYVPAARDLWLTQALIPHSTLNTAHTPLLSVLLTVVWSLGGYSITLTHAAMLAVACFGLWQVYRLAECVSNRAVAIATMALTAAYPVFFAQSAIAHSDLLATVLIWWGLREYLASERQTWRYVLAFTLAVMTKEIVIVVPAALALFELLRLRKAGIVFAVRLCAVPIAALAVWFSYQRIATGAWFGDPDYYRYNVSGTLTVQRVVLALLQRAWQAFGHLNMWVATLAMIIAMKLPAKPGRPRIAIPTQLAFATVIACMLLFHSVLGGALLTRYLLPIFPLILVIAASTWWRRVPHWEWLAAAVFALFAIACVVDPPYRFAPEDNLEYIRFIRLHQQAARTIEERFAGRAVTTAWPATDELSKPELGYVKQRVSVAQIRNFTAEQISALPERGVDVVLAFSTKYEPPRPLFRSKWWLGKSAQYFDYHRDLSPQEIANELSGRVVWEKQDHGQWVAVIERESPQNAQLVLPVIDPIYSRMR